MSNFTLQRDYENEKRIYWHLHDSKGATVWPFLDFIIDCVDTKQLDHKTVEGRAYSLLKWFRFLKDSAVDMWDACDLTLGEFRDTLLNHEAVNASKNQQARRRTINQDLRNIYIFYAWLQNDPEYGKGRSLLGPHLCQITSTLNSTAYQKSQRGKRYPMVFKRTGEHSRHRLGFIPRDHHRADLAEYFYRNFPTHIADRNCLLFEIAWAVGWRRGSILSLTTEDFDPARQSPSDEDFCVKPSKQKFGYENSFSVPHRLVSRILLFIDQQRLVGIRTQSRVASTLFLNCRTGGPLKESTVSSIFSRARVALGWPLGGGLHAWRRGFTNMYLERELDARMELGLDTSGETLAMSVAQALGHENIDSQAPYIRDVQRRIRGTTTFRDKEEIARLSDENTNLRIQIARLTNRG